jgi:threonine synthase
MQALGWVEEKPRMVAAQAAAAAPIVTAWQQGLADVEPVAPGHTVAEAIKVGRPRLGWPCLKAIKESRGAAVAVSDDEILEARSLLAECEGVFAEPAGAVPVAAAKRLRESGVIAEHETVVCVVTGHGLKQVVEERAVDFPVIDPALEALERALQGGFSCH